MMAVTMMVPAIIGRKRMTARKFPLSHIDPNPWRRLDRYPIRRETVDALKESIATTGWWDNVVAREDPKDPTRAQLAYGHHRYQALHELYTPDHLVVLNIRPLPDAQMVKIMARENMDEFGASAAVQHETVRTIVEAFSRDEIELYPREGIPAAIAGTKFKKYLLRWFETADLSQATLTSYDSILRLHILPYLGDETLEEAAQPEFIKALLEKSSAPVSAVSNVKAVMRNAIRKAMPQPSRRMMLDHYGGKVRIAPSFIMQTQPEGTVLDLTYAYTSQDIADFTGWKQEDGKPQWKVRDALNVLEIIEQGILTESEFEGLSSWKAGKVAEQARQELKVRKDLADQEPRPEVRERILAQGRQDTTDMARHVISDLLSKPRANVQIKESAAASGKLTPTSQRVPPEIDAFAIRLATQLNNLMIPGANNVKINNLEKFIEFQERATVKSRREVKAVLEATAERALKLASQLNVGEEETVMEETTVEVVDAEVVYEIEGDGGQ
jgi:hypothetical protein